MTSKIAVIVRLFVLIFAICLPTFLFAATLPVVLCTAGILTVMQSFHWLFINVGMNVLHQSEGYKQAKQLGYDPYFDSLPTCINPDANRTCYVLPFPEPQYDEFVTPPWWQFQCLNCYSRLEQQVGECWRCGAWLG